MPDGAPEWVTATKRAVDRASDAVQAQQELAALTKAAGALDSAIAELVELGRAGALGRGQWWPGADVPTELRSVLNAAGRGLESRKLTRAVGLLDTFVKDTQRSLRQAWRDHINTSTGHAAQLQDLAAVLSGGGGRLASVARDLKQARDALTRLPRLPDTDAVRSLDAVVAQYEAFESALSPGVKAFVAAVARGGASIDMVDAEVIAWLTENGVLHSFKVVGGSPPEAARG